MKPIIMLCIFVLIGYGQHPKVGDSYKKKGSSDRIKIEFIGIGKKAVDYAIQQELKQDSINDPALKMDYHWIDYILFTPEDSLRQCFVYRYGKTWEPRFNVYPLIMLKEYELIK